MWVKLLHRDGFANIHARIEPAPELGKLGTLIVEADLPTGRKTSVADG
ncbi:hypothetical protein ACIA2T_15805 [Amycolatopsis japonica]